MAKRKSSSGCFGIITKFSLFTFGACFVIALIMHFGSLLGEVVTAYPYLFISVAIVALIIVALMLQRRRNERLLNEVIANEGQDSASLAAYGIHDPVFSFSTVDGFKDRLKEIKEQQKALIREKCACITPGEFRMNNNKTEGARVVNDWVRLMLRAFNGESDVIIDHVTFLNFEKSKDKILNSAHSLNAIGERMGISITGRYVQLKLDELTLAFEYQQFKQAEKERIRQIREEEREKAKLEKELQERRNKILKDQKHTSMELASLTERLDTASEDDRESIQARIAELNEHMQTLQNDMGLVELREQQARAGYVYIISNIGSFGEDVYKIGMTRRLDPQDRVDELGDASVPFRFDVHAFIFATDAVQLESALHSAFDNKRVNLVNNRKEFFNVTLDEIEACVKENFSEVVEFTRTAEAQEYRQTLALRNAG